MFKLSQHVRKGVRLAAVGAAASVPVAAEAALLDYDGSPAAFQTGVNSFNGGTAALTSNDDVQFDTGPSTVPTGPVSVRTMSIGADGFTFSNNGTLTVAGSIAAPDVLTIMSLTTGNATINAPIAVPNFQTGAFGAFDVANGSTLTTGDITWGQYGTMQKNGGGTLFITGALATTNLSTNYGLDVTAGTVVLSGTGNVIGGQVPITIASGATLATSGALVTILDPAPSAFTVNGSISPNQSSTGTLNITSALYSNAPHITFNSGGSMDFNLVSPGTNDLLNVTSGEYISSLTFQNGSLLNLTGPFSEGTYTILTLRRSASQNRAAAFDFSTNVGTVDDGIGLDIGSAPAGFSYVFAAHAAEGSSPGDVYGGIDLIITAIPEPGTASMLGLGALGLLGHRRRR